MSNYAPEYFEMMPTEKGINVTKNNVCKYLDFKLLVLEAGQEQVITTTGSEYGFVVLTGQVNIKVNDVVFANLGGRATVFEGKPTMVFAPNNKTVIITAKEDCEVAICSTPGPSDFEEYVVYPSDVFEGEWGLDCTHRSFNYMINKDRPSARLHLAEVTVRNGNWATYPPHKHDEHRPEEGEYIQDEMYFYRTDADNGFGFCASYGDSVEDDYAFMIKNNTLHKMPNGYHTVNAAPGYKVWYLAAIAGPDKNHGTCMDPNHAWYLEQENETKRNHAK